MNASLEEVVIVDRENRVTGQATRGEMRARGLIHRATYILVFNSAGQIFVQHRTMTKDVYPGYLDPVTGGVVLAGESYEESAERELAEEIGVRGVEIARHGDFYFESEAPVWGALFSCTWDGPLVYQPEEVAGGEWMNPEEALARAGTENFTPDGLVAVRLWLERYRQR
ncbi:MAG: NUDIX hydrolase YfcD [Acidobacteria bacterium]|nr:NUDIX hydrolase YfcD [Acidobacteriota bacterium]